MGQSVVSQKPVEIFISYSRHDQQYAIELKKHLGSYERNGLISVWYDEKVNPGDDWEEEIYSHFCSASIILLLVSADFFDSEYCTKYELPAALKRDEENQATVVPIIIRPYQWKHSEIAHLNVLPSNSLPIVDWDSQDRFYQSVAASLFKQVDSLLKQVDPEFNVDGRRSSGKWGREPTGDTNKTATDGRGLPAKVRPDNSQHQRSDVREPKQPSRPTHASKPPTVSTTDGSARFRSEVQSLVPAIVVCFLHSERRGKLLDLRKWCRDPQDRLFGDNAARVIECATLEQAVHRVSKKPTDSLLLLDGFEPGSPQLDELLSDKVRSQPLNVIVNAPEWENFATQEVSASILQSLHAVTSDETLMPALRKALLRIRTRRFATARVLYNEEQLESFFRLRYRVWDQLGYLSDAKRCDKTQWELDYTDRTSLPLGIFSNLDGTLIGGARLVRGLGEEYPSLIRTITAMLEKQNAPVIQKNFEYPIFTTHPFDILGEFQRFQEYYRDLVIRGVSKAELSRVVVEPDYRELGLGEVLVDTLTSLARTNAVEVLFLACHSRHANFYERSQFNVVSGVAGDSFLTYRVPCIAMDRQVFTRN